MTEIIFIDAKWEGEIKLEKKLEDYLNKNKIKSLALFASVQFSDVNNLIKQIKNKKIKPVIMWNPISKVIQILDEKIIKEQIKRYKRNLKMFISADTIGIL